MPQKHIPVMLGEVIEYLKPKPNKFYIDCTLGAGGYTQAILEKIKPNGKIIAFDLDEKAINEIKQKNKNKNLILIHDNFKNLSKNLQQIFTNNKVFTKSRRIPAEVAVKIAETKKNEAWHNEFAGVVFDLGLSSDQLQDRDRGFSFRYDNSPLDMSFAGESEKDEINTYQIVNYYSENEISRIIKNYGEERFARSIAGNIVKARKIKKIRTVGELLEIIKKSVPYKYTQNRIHFATRTFQALRIATNNELINLEKTIPDAIDSLEKGGRIVVVSYHSLEDRIAKQIFKKESQNCLCESNAGQCVCQQKAKIKILSKKPILPSEEEIRINHRARSAKLRVAEKI